MNILPLHLSIMIVQATNWVNSKLYQFCLFVHFTCAILQILVDFKVFCLNEKVEQPIIKREEEAEQLIEEDSILYQLKG